MNCLLCLEINENYKNFIIFNSSEWLELDIQNIIEMHLWKVENFNSKSFVCQGCWRELHNFHKFYLRVEKARLTLNSLTNIEVISTDVGIHNKNEAEETCSDIKNEVLQLVPEILFLKEENISEIYEKEDEEEIKLNRRSKRLCSRKKCENKNVTKNSSRKNSSKEKRNNEIHKLACDKKQEETECKLQIKSVEESQTKSDTKQEEILTESKFDEIENEAKVTKIGENIGDQNVSHAVDSSKSDNLWDEDDKFIAEHFQITCTICQTPLATYALMLKHYKEEHNQRGYAFCCNRKLHPRIELIEHIKFHQNPEYFKCKYCNKILSKRICLKLHIKTAHEQKDMTYECDICGKILANEQGVRMHKYLHGANDNTIVQCKQCNKPFFSEYSLRKHIQVVHLKKNHKICELCGKSLSNIYIFKRHMLEHEGKPPETVKCELCGRILSDIGCLKRHMTSHHPPKGPAAEFKCSECTKVFALKSNLKEHMRRVHENSYARKCTLCDKIFKRSTTLKDHMSRHAGQPRHACGFCPRTFYSNGNMHAHRKREHPLEWQKTIREKFSGNLPEKYVTTTTRDQ